jgi:hypothetical protein
MGRSFESVRMGAKDVADRWLKARRAMKAEDQVYAVKLAGMAKKHSSEAFYAFNDPLGGGGLLRSCGDDERD